MLAENCLGFSHPLQCCLGVTGSPKMDVFLENSQTAFAPPPPSFLEITLRFFPENPLSMRKFAMKFFGLAMTPPPLPPFWKLHCAFLPKIYRFETNKICNVIFWIGNDPPPPSEVFQKNIHFGGSSHPLIKVKVKSKNCQIKVKIVKS